MDSVDLSNYRSSDYNASVAYAGHGSNQPNAPSDYRTIQQVAEGADSITTGLAHSHTTSQGA